MAVPEREQQVGHGVLGLRANLTQSLSGGRSYAEILVLSFLAAMVKPAG
jgi:hypothetical protein